MTPTDFAASSAIGLGVISMLACIISVPVIFNKGYDIQAELHSEMDEFKTLTDKAWGQMM